MLFWLALCALAQTAQVDAILEQTATVTGLRPKGSVRVSEADRTSLRETFKALMARQYPGDKLERMGQAFLAIRLLKPGANLREDAIKLYQGQVGGYYDPYTGRLVILKDIEELQRLQVLQHELVHALQDQHFSLQKLLDRAIADEDKALALQGAIEGQAMYALLAGPSPETLRELQLDGVLDAEDLKELAKIAAPDIAGPSAGQDDYLQAQLTFPYEEGARFIEAVAKKGGLPAAIRRTLEAPPRSTKQVLFPAAYLSGDEPTVVADLAERAVFATTVGALNIRTLFGGTSDLLAYWKGDRIFVLASGATAWLSVWDSSQHAAAFYSAYLTLLKPFCSKQLQRLQCGQNNVDMQRNGKWVAIAVSIGDSDALSAVLLREISVR